MLKIILWFSKKNIDIERIDFNIQGKIFEIQTFLWEINFPYYS